MFKGEMWRLVGKGTPWALSSEAGEGDDFPHPSASEPWEENPVQCSLSRSLAVGPAL